MVVGADFISDSMKSQGSGVDRNYHILNYVHHSSGVLRKVRLGQPLDTALHCNPSIIAQAEQHKYRTAVKPTPGKNAHLFDSCTSTTPLSGTNFHRERGLKQLKIPRSRQTLPIALPNNSRYTLRKRYLLPPTVNTIPLEKHLDLTYQQHIAPEEDEDHPSELPGSSLASPPELHNAALIIARFFRSVCRLDNAADRAREVLRQRWREKHPEKYRTPLFELTGSEQLRVLQLYNPHLYGSQHPVSPLKSASISIRLSRVPHMEKHKRLRQSQILARMDQETALLNDTCKQKMRTTVTAATTLHEAYRRQSPSARDRPKIIHEREQTQLTEDWVASTKSPPNFRYRTTLKYHHLFTRKIKGISSLKPLQN